MLIMSPTIQSWRARNPITCQGSGGWLRWRTGAPLPSPRRGTAGARLNRRLRRVCGRGSSSKTYTPALIRFIGQILKPGIRCIGTKKTSRRKTRVQSLPNCARRSGGLVGQGTPSRRSRSRLSVQKSRRYVAILTRQMIVADPYGDCFSLVSSFTESEDGYRGSPPLAPFLRAGNVHS